MSCPTPFLFIYWHLQISFYFSASIILTYFLYFFHQIFFWDCLQKKIFFSFWFNKFQHFFFVINIKIFLSPLIKSVLLPHWSFFNLSINSCVNCITQYKIIPDFWLSPSKGDNHLIHPSVLFFFFLLFFK